MGDVYTVSTLARQIGAKPRDISNAFYERRLDDSRCPVIRGRRLIPKDYVPEIQDVLSQSGKLAARGTVQC